MRPVTKAMGALQHECRQRGAQWRCMASMPAHRIAQTHADAFTYALATRAAGA
jgi:hypothetical protein